MKDFSAEIFYKTARSGGKGGQNVNKVETMAEAWWNVAASQIFTDEEKQTIQTKLARKITKDGLLLVKSSETRSQLENKLIARQKMEDMVQKSLVTQKKRRPTKPSKGAVEKRLEGKKIAARKKEDRRSGWEE